MNDFRLLVVIPSLYNPANYGRYSVCLLSPGVSYPPVSTVVLSEGLLVLYCTLIWKEYYVGILPDGYIRTNPLPQIPTKQSVPPSKDSLLGYYGIPLAIPTLRSLIGPSIDKVRIPWLSFH